MVIERAAAYTGGIYGPVLGQLQHGSPNGRHQMDNTVHVVVPFRIRSLTILQLLLNKSAQRKQHIKH